MKKYFLSTLLVLSAVASTHAQEEQEFTPIYKYRICLKDKKGTAFSVKHPEQFLSQKSIERRRRQKLKVNKTAGEALQQIEDKAYAKPFDTDERKLFKIGINFNTEKRLIDDWKVVERIK